MADLSEYSTAQQKVIKELVKNDRGFHNSFMIADMPFYGMLEEMENGETTVSTDISCSLNSGGTDITLYLHYSTEQNCWFYTMNYLGEEIRGIVHYNTLFNSMGELAFAILNDNVSDTDLSLSLPYSNVFIMRK